VLTYDQQSYTLSLFLVMRNGEGTLLWQPVAVFATTGSHFYGFYLHRESKKGDTIVLSISLLNIDRFSQFFHRRTQHSWGEAGSLLIILLHSSNWVRRWKNC